MKQERAETIALTALAWLVGNDALLPVFLGATGGDVADLRDRAQDPATLAGVLDFLTMNDNWVIDFCDGTNTPYADPLTARAILNGGEIHWT